MTLQPCVSSFVALLVLIDPSSRDSNDMRTGNGELLRHK
jgi:hypothetical protein